MGSTACQLTYPGMPRCEGRPTYDAVHVSNSIAKTKDCTACVFSKYRVGSLRVMIMGRAGGTLCTTGI